MAALAPMAPIFLGVAFAICTNIPPIAGGGGDLPEEPPVVAPLAASTLPIEVLGPNGTIRSVSIVVTNGDTADNIWFQVHNLSFEGKMSFRANGGSWITLTDTNVVYPDRERGMYGMGGISSTLRFHYTIDGDVTLYNGTNDFDFRFNDNSESMTIGYRVLNFSPRVGTNMLIHSSQFTHDDPATWTPPSSAPADIADGKDAWMNLTITERGTNIVAKCTDCHAWDGRDLKYFNYSAKSIIERSIFHSVPAARATNIASYILSLSVPYATNARPWNPPYQPGPGIDSLPVNQWSAGMGLDWVQETGTNALAYMFPSGITTNALNLTNGISAREVPLCIPFPDWNNWLPKIHPLDMDYGFFSNNRFYTIYPNEIRPGISNRTGSAAAKRFNNWKTVWDSAGSGTPPGDNYAWIRDRRAWRMVKTWEIMNEFAIQDYGLATDGVFTNMVNGAELNDRRWFHKDAFSRGPHVITGSPKDERFYWESAAWYQLQLVLNDANRLGGSIVPIDWGYLHALNQSAWNNEADFASWDALLLNVIKGLEVGCNGLPMSNTHGFNPFKANVYRMEGDYFRPFSVALPDELRKAWVEAIGIRWIESLESFTYSDYDASGRLIPGLNGLFTECITWWGPTGLGIDSSLISRLEAVQSTLFP